MEESINFKCSIAPTNPSAKLGLRIYLDGKVLSDFAHVDQSIDFCQDLSSVDGTEHLLEFELYGKLQEHTKVDAEGNIVEDAMVSITNIEFDDIDVTCLIDKIAVYSHSMNSDQPPSDYKFYDHMGCNGRVKIAFTTPVYLWLLELM